MQVEKIIDQTIDNILTEQPELFVIKKHISPGLDINITIDGDRLVNISDCIDISRKIEQSLDRDELDFSIKVQSPGADEPLILLRQYNKHIGRKLEVNTATDSYEGQLKSVGDDSITLTWKSREKKPNGKGKITVQHEKSIPFSEIEKAKIKITFNNN
jgi:ribosome maturation factor RimP